MAGVARLAIVGTFGTTPIPAAGPLRVSRSLAGALFGRGVCADLYELKIPRSRFRRFTVARERDMVLPGLPTIHTLSPRQTMCLGTRGYSLVHFLGTLSFYTVPVLWRLRARGIPTMATLHGLYAAERASGYPYGRLDVWGERIGLRLVNHVVAVSAPFRDLVARTYPHLAGHIRVVEHGFDGIRQPGPHGEGPRADVLTMVGTRGVKGAPFLLAAVERLLEHGERPKVIIAGPAGDDHHAVMRTIARLQPQVSYVGEQPPDDVGRLYSGASIYVQPSPYESFGIAVVEAMAHALPVVVTRECGASTLIVDGESGFVVEYGDVAALADRLARLLHDAGLRQAMGRAARTATQSCTWDTAADRYIQIYADLACDGAPVPP